MEALSENFTPSNEFVPSTVVLMPKLHTCYGFMVFYAIGYTLSVFFHEQFWFQPLSAAESPITENKLCLNTLK